MWSSRNLNAAWRIPKKGRNTMENTAQQNEKQKRKSSNFNWKLFGIEISRMMASGAFAALGAAATNSVIKSIGRSKGGADVLPMKRAL